MVKAEGISTEKALQKLHNVLDRMQQVLTNEENNAALQHVQAVLGNDGKE